MLGTLYGERRTDISRYSCLNGSLLPMDSRVTAQLVLKPDFDTRPGIQKVAESVANKVKCQHGEHDCDRGKDHQVRCVQQMRAAIIEHGSPACGWRGDSESEKAHR